MSGPDRAASSASPALVRVYDKRSDTYEVLDYDTAARSTFLQGFLDAEGDMQLPDSVALEDFITWRDAGPLREDSTEDISTICRVLKVADMLGDSNANALQKLVRSRLMHHVSHTPLPFQGSVRDDIVSSLSLLPHSLLGRIVATAQPFHLHQLLDLLPPHTHTAVLQATVSLEKTLTAPLVGNSLPYLAALATVPASPPSYYALDVHRVPMESPLPSTEPPLPPEALPLLAAALHAHAGITSLSLGCIRATSAATPVLAAAIASLTSLRVLRLGSISDGVDASDLPLRSATIRSLPHLRHFQLCLRHSKPPWESSAAADDPTSFSDVSTLAACTRLETLTIHNKDTGYSMRWLEKQSSSCPLVATQPFQMPHLSHLELTGGTHTLAAPLLTLLDAPLATLIIGDLASRESKQYGGQHLHFDISRFTLLQTLRIDLPLLRSQPHATSGSLVVEAGTTLPHLRRVAIAAHDDEELIAVIPTIIAASGSLEHLRVSLRGNLHLRDPDVQAVQDLLYHLQSPRLSALTIRLFDEFRSPEILSTNGCHAMIERPRLPIGLAPSVGELLEAQPDLTRLQLTWCRNCLSSEWEIAALACLTRLRCLEVHDFCADMHEHLVGALQALSELTDLSLTQGHLRDRFVEQFAAAAPAWPELRRVCFGMEYLYAGQETLIRASPRFPALREIAFQAGLKGQVVEVSCEVREAMNRRNVYGCLQSRLYTLAATYGVRLMWHACRFRGCHCLRCKQKRL